MRHEQRDTIGQAQRGRVSCKHIHPDGRACGAPALKDSEFCFAHDDRPEIVAKRRDAQSRGGRGRKAKNPPWPPPHLFSLDHPQQIPAILNDTLDLTLRGLISLKRGEFVRKMAESAMRAHQFAAGSAKIDELERLVLANRKRPDQAEVDALIRFVPDDAAEIAQAIADRDEVEPSVRPEARNSADRPDTQDKARQPMPMTEGARDRRRIGGPDGKHE